MSTVREGPCIRRVQSSKMQLKPTREVWVYNGTILKQSEILVAVTYWRDSKVNSEVCGVRVARLEINSRRDSSSLSTS